MIFQDQDFDQSIRLDYLLSMIHFFFSPFFCPPVEVTQFWSPFFVKPIKVILIKRQGNSMKQKLLEMIQVTVWLHTDEFNFIWFYKKENKLKNHSSGAKTELLRRAGATI